MPNLKVMGICLAYLWILAQNMNYTVVINTAVWFGAIAYYYIDARKWFTGTSGLPKSPPKVIDLLT